MNVFFEPINRELRTANREPRTANCEPRTANCEPRTANCEPRTANCELRTANRELRTANSLDEGERRSAFSLIEVLVATALLVMVVGMIGFVFRQSSMSWDSGIQRAEGISQVRAVMGAIERDLRLAVDAREFGMDNDFSRNGLTFIALVDPEAGSNDRVPTQIEYTSGTTVQRTATRLTCANGRWHANGTRVNSTLLERESSASPIKVSYHVLQNDSDRNGLPAYVTVNAEVEVSEEFSGLKVLSFGPNGKEGDRDDIVVN